jgi:mannose-6-phosphate isomerase-like protein (cupin superfamily)
MEVKNIGKPDERREFPQGHTDVLSLPGLTFAVATFEPGWRWSECVQQIAGTSSCQIHHNGFCVRGRALVRMDDGSESEITAGDVFVIPPGHDAWVVGDEPLVLYGFVGGAEQYAKVRGASGRPGSRRGSGRR